MPSSTTGTAMVGISVARRFCRNSHITRNTSRIASTSVLTTSSIDLRTNGVVSYGDAGLQAGRKAAAARRCSSASTLCTVRSALAPVASVMPMPEAGLPL